LSERVHELFVSLLALAGDAASILGAESASDGPVVVRLLWLLAGRLLLLLSLGLADRDLTVSLVHF